MNTQYDLFDPLARENADALLSKFLRWFDAFPVTEGDRPPVEWFAREARSYLQNPLAECWSNV